MLGFGKNLMELVDLTAYPFKVITLPARSSLYVIGRLLLLHLGFLISRDGGCDLVDLVFDDDMSEVGEIRHQLCSVI